MSAKSQVQLWSVAISSVVITVAAAPTARALPRTWIGGNVDWVDGGAAANWTPADEPDADDEAIFNTANTVNLGSNSAVNGLTLSGGIDLNTNDFDLSIAGLVQLVDVNTNLIVGGSDSTLLAQNVTINNAADVEMAGGALSVGLVPAAGFGVLDVNAGGELVGHGSVNLIESLLASETLLVNDGAISASRNSLVIFGAPQIGTLSINATDTDARIDLDGTGENGVLNVFRNQTLDVNVAPAPLDTFDGDLNLFHNSTFDSALSWTLASGTIDVDNGFIDGVFPNPDVPADTSFIAGGSLTQTGGTITVVDTDGTLQFDSTFNMNGGALINNGHIIFSGNATVVAAANFSMPTTSSSITVDVGRTVTINQTNFDLDGANSLTNVITVEQGGLLTVNVSDYDPDAAPNRYDGTINLDGGEINVTTGDAEFIMDGTLNMHSTSGNLAVWDGEPIDIGNDASALDADVNVTGESLAPAQFAAPVDFNSDADVNVAVGGTLQFLTLATVNFNTVNAANNAEFTGAGDIAFNGTVNVNEAVTLNMVGGTVDLDGFDETGEFINIDAPLTVNAATFENFGQSNSSGGTNTLDINNSIGSGVLTVSLDDPIGEWTLNGPGVMNLVNDNTDATLLAGSDVNINGIVNVTGDVRTTARLDIAGVVNISTAGQPLRLAGGTLGDPNTISGGTISGAGVLGAGGTALHGFGTINTAIDFDSPSNLFADDGTLTINGSILDVGRIGTNDADGVLNVVNPWSTNVAQFVQLEGGELKGGTVTVNNVNGLGGFGLISARIINDQHVRASDGTLVLQTAGNDNDWDGPANDASLIADAPGDVLELRDNATFGFTGSVSTLQGGRVFTNGFALDFNPGSNLFVNSGGTYESTHSTDLGGLVSTIAGADSTIKVANNVFLTFESTSTTTLGGNLRVENNNINVEAGATFSGGGALIVPDGSHVVADNLANVGVLLDMQGGFRPGNSEGIGRIDLLDYQQSNTGELFVEIKGTALNAFDRLVASGDVVLDGYLNIDIDEIAPMTPFVPVLGQTFNIITGNTVTGTFDYADVSNMPPGLAFHIAYLPNAVQLQVVNEPFFSADFDNDGDVDPTDLAIWDGAFDLNQLGDADGDNDSDGNDFLLWQRQLGSAPAVAAASVVPEPAAWTLVGIIAAYLSLPTYRRLRKP